MERERGVNVDIIYMGDIIRGVKNGAMEYAAYAPIFNPYIGIMDQGGLLPDPHIAVATDMRIRQMLTKDDQPLPKKIVAPTLLGVNGCGKGTQAKNIRRHYHDPVETHLPSTAIEVVDGGARTLKQYLDNRELFKRIREEGVNGQAVPVQELCIFYDLSVEEAQKRSFARLTDAVKKLYNIDNRDVPKRITQDFVLANYDEVCARPETGSRSDDHPDLVRDRIVLFQTNSKPVVEQSKADGLYIEVNAAGKEYTVAQRTFAVLEPYLLRPAA